MVNVIHESKSLLRQWAFQPKVVAACDKRMMNNSRSGHTPHDYGNRHTHSLCSCYIYNKKKDVSKITQEKVVPK